MSISSDTDASIGIGPPLVHTYIHIHIVIIHIVLCDQVYAVFSKCYLQLSVQWRFFTQKNQTI